MNDRSREAQVVGNLGGVYLAQGNSEQAVTLYREAADTFRELKDEERYGQTLLAIADVQMKSGKLSEAIQSLSAEIRENPTDAQMRVFLFELLCFAGDYDRADKHLNLLADQSPQAQMGAVLYMSSLHGERLRQKTLRGKRLSVRAGR